MIVRQQSINWVDNARIISIFAVVVLHCSAEVVAGNIIGSASYWVGNIFDSAVRWCVPVFAAISGYLLLNGASEERKASFFRKRFEKILIPVLVWSVFYLL